MTIRTSALTSLVLASIACGERSAGNDDAFDELGTDGSSDDERGTADSVDDDEQTDAADDDAEQEDDGDGTKFDTLLTDGGSPTCMGGNICEDAEFSYIWIANSGENTVTKLDTRTMIEEGRYQSRPDGGGSPSRTSVSVDGRAVAVANRHVGITKIWANVDDCEDHDQDGTIDTSTGKLDVLPFAQEECIAWHTAFPAMSVQRPVAWTSGSYDGATCEWVDQKIWTVTGEGGPAPGACAQNSPVSVHRLNGDTGEVEESVTIPSAELPCADISSGSFGPYGAAVDNEGNLWFHVWSQTKVVRVDYDTLAHQLYDSNYLYGITVDSQGRPWDDSPRRLDPVTGVWANPIGNLQGTGGSGVAEDLQGRMWKATVGGVGWVDMETMVVGDTVLLPEGNVIYRGISVDVDGFIWAIPRLGSRAYKIDPSSYEVESYDGLAEAYTYSDMSGGQLSNVTCNPPEG